MSYNLKPTPAIFVALLAASCASTSPSTGQPVDQAASFLAAVEDRDQATFDRLAQPDIREFVPGDMPGTHRFEELTLERMAEFLALCDVSNLREWAGSVEFDTECRSPAKSNASYFVFRDGKIALFYPLTQPLMQAPN